MRRAPAPRRWRTRSPPRPRRELPARTLGAGVTAALLLGGCGGIKAPDLFIVTRSGRVAGAQLTLLINEEGGVRCNGGPTRKLADSQLIEARTIQEDMRGPASRHLSLPPQAGSVLSYRLRQESGSVAFSDNPSGQPGVFRRLSLFVLQTAQRVCRLPL